jgi:L-malate glycosyltransferase
VPSLRLCILGPSHSAHTQRWVNVLKQRGHQVELISLHPSDDSKGDVAYVGASSRRWLGKWGFALAVPRVRARIRKFRPDIVHAHRLSSYGIVAWLACGDVPLIVSAWGEDVYLAPRNAVVRLGIRRVLAKAAVICATSRHLAAAVRDYTPKDAEVKVIPFGVKTDVPTASDGPPDTDLVIGTVRHLRPNYGIDILLRAFALVVGKVQVRLVIGGDGPQRRELEALAVSLGISDRVTFLGRVPPDRVPDLVSSLDVYAMPSLYESFGVAALEAQAASVPVVASAVGGLVETVQEGGVLVPPGDPQRLAEGLLDLLQDKVKRQSLGAAGRQFVLDHYSWERSVDQMEHTYFQALEKRGIGLA